MTTLSHVFEVPSRHRALYELCLIGCCGCELVHAEYAQPSSAKVIGEVPPGTPVEFPQHIYIERLSN